MTNNYKEQSYPLLSVIVPVYNCEAYIEKCILSILQQSYPNIEIILIDDGSSDESLNVCKELRNRHSNIHIIHKDNAGQAAARNDGIKASKGQLIAFVDGDDFIDKRMYETLYINLITENADISCGGIQRVENGKLKSLFNNIPNEYEIFDKLSAINKLLDNKKITSSPCDKLFRRCIVENTPMKEGMIFEDYEVMPKWINNANKIVYTSQPLYYYRTNPVGTMSDTSEKRLDEIRAADSRLNFINSNYPSLMNKMILIYITTGLNVLSCTVGIENCEVDRLIIRNKILKKLTLKRFLNLGLYTKIKLIVLVFGLAFFDNIGLIKKI